MINPPTTLYYRKCIGSENDKYIILLNR